MVFSAVSCSKDSEFIDANNQLQEKNATIQYASRTATQFGVPDNTDVLKTSIWPKLATFDHTAFPTYDFSPYFVNGETAYNADNYDLMVHFVYISPAALTDAVVEFTFPQIIRFFPHVIDGNEHRTFIVNNQNNQTVITTVTNLDEGWNPMFCFMVKADCSKGKSGFCTIWSDIKVNGVSVKGTVKNKVFECN
ncbi:MAG TPA: hypothetical protein DER05_06135 [Lutibacter sp.]|nr:hypothetical protein [Lutibacter sp.]